ncbi:MAG: VanW family protein, partial [Actinomycetes bacterium]|nr:VanW family protein [Actinomycetes bacterium]MDX5380108.1 VanW family protein [Actinomycetes bacterium]MDX5398705.1 VanW family protein [Actinomycetes bacterium]MDX5449817.1 VanW family protein [Actinomycetes bacterium]
FVESGGVENGFYSKALGGGLSQLSTTTYNAAYFAGMDLVEHKPHSRWFSRYPEGREATMWVPTVDMKFRNSTPHGVLVQAWVEGGRVWVRFWSTPYFEVRTETSDRYNITQPQTVYNSDPECLPESGGQVGFTVRVTRWRYLEGELHDRESWTWTYAPWNRVECGSAP